MLSNGVGFLHHQSNEFAGALARELIPKAYAAQGRRMDHIAFENVNHFCCLVDERII